MILRVPNKFNRCLLVGIAYTRALFYCLGHRCSCSILTSESRVSAYPKGIITRVGVGTGSLRTDTYVVRRLFYDIRHLVKAEGAIGILRKPAVY